MESLTELLYSTEKSPVRTPYLIAEAGVNHEGSMETAERLIEEAAEGGADAIKFQTYKAELIASKDSPAYWDRDQEPTATQFELFKKYDKFWKEEYETLKKLADRAGIEFLSTPFDVHSADFLSGSMPAFKVSSSDLDNLPFIDHLCSYGKPILLSTGASYKWEIQRAVELIEDHGLPVCLMHCVLSYPTDPSDVHLGMLDDLKRSFPGTVLGYSDHAMPGNMEVLEAATLMGSQVIEKHFTHDKKLPGNDHYHAMDKEDLKGFREKMDQKMELLGSFEKTVLECETSSRKNARRSLVAHRQIPEEKRITMEDLTWKRPAKGISPSLIEEVLDRKASRTIEADEILDWKDIGEKE